MATPKHIQRLKRGEGTEKFIQALEQDGGVIIEDFADVAIIEQANAEVKPWIEEQKNNHGAKVGALGGKTRTVTRLVMRSPTVRDKFFADPLYQALCEHFLALETTTWYGETAQVNTSHPLLSISIAFDIPPGTSAQGLHRDDKNHHARHPPATKYSRNRDMLLGLFVPGCDTMKANGATRVIPGSHLWGDEKPDFGSDGAKDVVDAELKKGEAFIMLGSLYHGGGAYEKPITSNPEAESRTVYAMFSCFEDRTGKIRMEAKRAESGMGGFKEPRVLAPSLSKSSSVRFLLISKLVEKNVLHNPRTYFRTGYGVTRRVSCVQIDSSEWQLKLA